MRQINKDNTLDKILSKAVKSRNLRDYKLPRQGPPKELEMSEERKREIRRLSRINQAYENTGIAREDLFRCNFKTWESEHLTPEFYKVFEFCKTWNPDNSPHGLILCGLPGVGKTHLLQALLIAHSSREQPGLYLDWVQVLSDLKAEFRAPSGYPQQLLAKIRQRRIILLDEIGYGGESKEYAQEFFRQILNVMITKGSYLFGTSNKSEAQLKEEFGKPDYDRIRELSEFYDVNITNSFRKTINERNTRFFRKMMG